MSAVTLPPPTAEKAQRFEKMEALFHLRDALQHDKESCGEILGELLEERREQIVNCGLDPSGIEAAMKAVEEAYEGVRVAVVGAVDAA